MEASSSGRERTHEELMRIIVVLVVIIVVLSALATIFFIQMEDYRGAKYRSQLEICVDIQNTLTDCGIKISWVLDYPPDSTLASYGALVSSLDADRLHHSFVEIAVMYPSHQKQHLTFEDLGGAFSQLSVLLAQVYGGLNGANHDLQPSETLSLETVLPLIGSLYGNFSRAVQENMTFSSQPGSTVNHLDLDAMREIAAEIVAAL